MSTEMDHSPRDIEELPNTSPLTEEEEERLKEEVISLAQHIFDLIDHQESVEDIALAQEMGQAIKPYVDRLVSLKRLLNPLERIIEKRTQLEKLQAGLDADVAEVENLSEGISADIDTALFNDLQGEISAVKKDCRIFVNTIDEKDERDSRKPSGKSTSLLDQPIALRLEQIFGTRFVGLDRLADILHLHVDEETAASYTNLLEKVWKAIFQADELRPHVKGNRIKTLQHTFRNYALIFRTPEFPAQPGARTAVPCTIASLRDRFGEFFLGASERSLWYSRLDFFRQPMAEGHWAMVDRQFLNCTFRKPGIRLHTYARANGLPAEMVRQKSAVEEIYDRVILEMALKERFFPNYNAITRTTYPPPGESTPKQVYIYYKDNYIRISGKRGIPHWLPTKPRWPGVSPAIIFDP